MQIKEINDYNGLGRAIFIANNQYELVVTLDVGPRILWFSVLDGDNMLADNVQETETLPDGSEWRLYGGHRIWHSPEQFPRTYLSDSHPVEKYELNDDGIIIHQQTEPGTQIQKSLKIKFESDCIEIQNQLTNCSPWPIETSVWAITVVPPGGYAVCPVAKTDTGLLPNACYVTWPYTRLNDDRLHLGEKFIKIFADAQTKEEFKIGYSNPAGWIAYIKDNDIFIKQFCYASESTYPDFGCSTEIYTSHFGLEMETLSPVGTLGPDETLVHREYWHIQPAPKNIVLEEIEFEERMIKRFAN